MRPQHITAENRDSRLSSPRPRPYFNEAAAYHCGKHPTDTGMIPDPAVTSMRPQHITAENDDRGGGGAVVGDGTSMRPQHITAENAARHPIRLIMATILQ